MVGAYSDGYLKPVAACVSEYWKSFAHELFPDVTQTTIKPQVLRQVNQTVWTQNLRFQPQWNLNWSNHLWISMRTSEFTLISMTHGTFMNSCPIFTTSTNQPSSLPDLILRILDMPVVAAVSVTRSVLATFWTFEFVDIMKRTIWKPREWVRRDSPTEKLHFLID